MKNRKERKKRIIIVCLLIIISFFSICYAVLAKNKDIIKMNTGDTNWNIEITNIDTINKVGTSKNSFVPKIISPMSATFGVDLKKPGDSITYRIKIKNSGFIDAYLKDILVSENNYNSDIIKYSISGVTTGKTLLNINEVNYIYLKVYFDESKRNLQSISESYLMVFVYEQKRN